MKNFITAIIPCAGSSTRMGIDKQFIEICSKPAIIHTLTAFENTDIIDEIIIVTKKENIDKIQYLSNKYNIKKLSKIVEGGNSRQESVSCGIKAADPRVTYFCIHDGARILITADAIKRVVTMAVETRAATAGVLVKDTIKVVGENNIIESTPDRSKLWAIQTPQVFEKSLYLKALDKAIKDNKDYTDDCQLVENIGADVHVCDGDYTNIKLTTLDDIEQATAILNKRDE